MLSDWLQSTIANAYATRPVWWTPVPGQYLVVERAEEAGPNVFCAVIAWSRVRLVCFGPDQTRAMDKP